MGCDIHLHVEVKDDPWPLLYEKINVLLEQGDKPGVMRELRNFSERGSFGKWREASNEELFGAGFEASTWRTDKSVPEVYDSRNYVLFSILAGVRNYQGIEPIAHPRGLPADVSSVVRADSNRWGEDGHSHSYLTVADLMNYAWGQGNKGEGYVAAEVYDNWDKVSAPYPNCSDVSGGKVVKISAIQYEMLKMTKSLDAGKSYYIPVEWVEPAEDASGFFKSKVVDKLAKLGKPEDVRIVFWFDN